VSFARRVSGVLSESWLDLQPSFREALSSLRGAFLFLVASFFSRQSSSTYQWSGFFPTLRESLTLSGSLLDFLRDLVFCPHRALLIGGMLDYSGISLCAAPSVLYCVCRFWHNNFWAPSLVTRADCLLPGTAM
jgi:hypothetical protein